MDCYSDVLGYEPSEYQKKIFDFVVHGNGNGVVKARAGSGKTATMIACIKLIDRKKKCLFLAFNKSVQSEISEKLAGFGNCTVKTVHGLGYSMLMSHTGGKIKINDYKYNTYLRNNIKSLSFEHIKSNEMARYLDRIIRILDFSRLDLAQSLKEIRNCASNHGIDEHYDECSVVKKLMTWGKKNISEADFTDLVWLPNELDILPAYNTYDWIFNDEAQDYSIAYVNLFLKCFRRGTRFISCGDEYQSINQFAGASDKAFSIMESQLNTSVFKLPISYRCDRAIISEANGYVDDIEASERAGEGTIVNDSKLSDIRVGDMVLSRTNAPLFRLYNKLVNKGIPCYIKGVDNTSKSFKKIINDYSVDGKLGKDFSCDGMFPRLYKELVEECGRLVHNGLSLDDAIETDNVKHLFDMISSLDSLSRWCSDSKALEKKIDDIFQKNDEGVCLSTIHKAKGLESDTVHILNINDMPDEYIKNGGDLQQELNLIYVAITRARHRLCYVSEKEFPSMVKNNEYGTGKDEYRYIEDKVCKMYGLNPVKENDLVEKENGFSTAKTERHSKKSAGTNVKSLDSHGKKRNRKLLEKL